MIEPIHHSRPWIVDRDVESVTKVLASSMLGQGQQVRMLEQRLATWLNVEEGVAVSSGSAAILLALHALGVSAGDEVILPTYVCRSVLEAVLSVEAQPIFCDVGPDWVVTVENVSHLVTKKTRVLIIPHIYGIFADTEAFRQLGVPILEDFAQALDDVTLRTVKGDVAILSFHPTKCLTSGEGGMVISNNQDLIGMMRACRDGDHNKYGPRFFAPMSDIAGALAHSQLDRYRSGLERRREIAEHYIESIKQIYPSALNLEAFTRSMFFRFPIRLSSGLASCQDAFGSMGVNVRRGVDELLHRYYGMPDSTFPLATAHFDMTVSLPIYPALTRQQESRCVSAISHVLKCLSQSN